MSDNKSPIGFIDLDPSEIEAAMHRKVERDARIVQLEEEITRLRAALATARRDGMKNAARWHEVRSMELSGKAGVARNFRQLLRQSDFHMESAAVIRAAAGEVK